MPIASACLRCEKIKFYMEMCLVCGYFFCDRCIDDHQVYDHKKEESHDNREPKDRRTAQVNRPE